MVAMMVRLNGPNQPTQGPTQLQKSRRFTGIITRIRQTNILGTNTEKIVHEKVEIILVGKVRDQIGRIFTIQKQETINRRVKMFTGSLINSVDHAI